MRRIAALLLALAALPLCAAGCGSASVAELPAPAGPARSALVPADRGRLLAAVDGRARTLELLDPGSRRRVASAPAGIGPTAVAAEAGRLYVTDARGDALLVFAVHPKLELVRRVFLPGEPYAVSVDHVRHRLWVALRDRDEVVSLPANGRPRPLVRLRAPHRPEHVSTDSARGTVRVGGHDGGLRVIGPREAYPEDEG